MPVSRGRLGGAALAMLAAGMLLAACSSDDGRVSAGVTATATPAATATTAAPGPAPTPAWPRVATALVATDDLNVRTGPSTGHAVIGRLQPGDEVPVSGRAAGRWLALTGIGWAAYLPEWVNLDVPFESLPEITPAAAGFEFAGALHPDGTSTGLPVVDEVVGVVVRGDRDAMLRLAGTATTAGGADATPPRAAGCPDGARPASAIPEYLDRFFASEVVPAGTPLRLYAVVGAPGGDDRDPEFVAVFAFEGGEGRQIWVDAGGAGITWLNPGCVPTLPGDMLQLGGGEPFFWVRPLAPAPLTPLR